MGIFDFFGFFKSEQEKRDEAAQQTAQRIAKEQARLAHQAMLDRQHEMEWQRQIAAAETEEIRKSGLREKAEELSLLQQLRGSQARQPENTDKLERNPAESFSEWMRRVGKETRNQPQTHERDKDCGMER